MPEYRVDWDHLPWEHPGPGARYKACQEGGRRLRLVEFTRELQEPDWCTKGHIGYVLEGEFEVAFHDTLVHYIAGDGVFIPAGPERAHKASILSHVVRLVLVEEV